MLLRQSLLHLLPGIPIPPELLFDAPSVAELVPVCFVEQNPIAAMGNICYTTGTDGKGFEFSFANIRAMRRKREEKALRSAGSELSEPYTIDWSKARSTNWQFEEVKGPGSFFYKFAPVIDKVQGPIEEGRTKLRERPSEFEGLMYQSNMVDWPKDQQKYDLIKRTESGYRFKPGTEPNFTFVQAKYMALKPHSEIGEFERDAFTDKMHFRGQRLAAACHPGRGQGVCDVPHIKLIGEIHPNDIVQGSVGDCWLLSAISALSEFEGAIAKIFRKTNQIDRLPRDAPTKYTVTLYDLKSWSPVDIEIDERLCMLPDGSDLLGAHPSYDAELWACYLEKAVAIHCGGWDELDGGQCPHAWRILTGCNDQYVFMDDGDGFECWGKFNPNTETWEPMENSIKKSSQTIWRMDWPEVGGGGDKRTKCGHNEMFERMCAWDDQNYVMAAGTKPGSDTNTTDGIVDGHAYTVITCLNDVAGTTHDLIKVRNPWGRGEFTSGEWCDDGPGWKKHPEVKQVCKPVNANDGVFWVSKEEFFKYFKTIYLCATDMKKSQQLQRLRTPVASEAILAGVASQSPEVTSLPQNPLVRPAGEAAPAEYGRTSATVHPTAVLRGDVELGEGCVVGEHAIVGPRVRLGARCRIAAMAIVEEDVTLDEDCEVGPRGLLRGPLVAGKRNRFDEGCFIGCHSPLSGALPNGHISIGDDCLFEIGSIVRALLMKMGRAMTIKVAAAESDPSTPLAGVDCLDEEEEAASRWEKEVRLPGRPLSHDGLLFAGDSPVNQPATLSPAADSAASAMSPGSDRGIAQIMKMKSIRSVSSRRSVGSRRHPSRTAKSMGDLSVVTPRHTGKSAKNFRRGRKRVMVAGMNAKKPLENPADRPSPETLLAFLRGFGPGPEGKDIEDILAWTLDDWENRHNYIQWLFPTDEESEYHPEAPVLTPEIQEQMLVDSAVEDSLIRSFEKFMQFLGLQITYLDEEPQEVAVAAVNSLSTLSGASEVSPQTPSDVPARKVAVTVRKASSFRSRRIDCWVVNCPEGNHNWFRISRVLISLRLLGLLDEAEAFYLCLEQLWADGDLPGFAVHSMRIWRECAGLESRPLPKRRKRKRGPCACIIS
ncbi:DEK1 [Symbiodinium sp. CCMP2456]|nr:DEK1 [Symbiodinium sp. CCMP2456]